MARSQDYTLRLNITADGSQAVSEAQRVENALHPRRRPAAGSALGAAGGAFAGGASVLGGVVSAFSTACSVMKGAVGGVFSMFRGIASFIRGSFNTAWGLAMTALKGLVAVFGTITAAAYSVKKLLDPAGRMQSFRSQLLVMTKSPAETERRMKVLTRYAKETNFSPDEVIGAGNRLQAYGMYSFRTLKAAGDAANAFGKSIDEVITSLSYLKAGRGGEAMESLSRVGVTRDKLKEYGVRFGNQGQLKSSTEKAVKAVIRLFEHEYGGMTQRVGKTWVGAMQQVGGEVFDALAKGFKGAVTPVTEFVTARVIPLIEKAGTALAAIDWESRLAGPVSVLSGLLTAVGNFLDPETRQEGKSQLSGLWEGFKKVGSTFLNRLGGVFTGAIQSIGKTLGNMIKTDAFGKVISAGVGLFNTVLQSGIMLFKSVLFSFSPEFQMAIESILEKIPGLHYKSKSREIMENSAGQYLSYILTGNKTENPLGLPEDTMGRMRGWVNNEVARNYGITKGKRLEDHSTRDLSDLLRWMEKDFRKAFKSDFMQANADRIKAARQKDIDTQTAKMERAVEDFGTSLADALKAVGGAIDLNPLKDSLSALGASVSSSAGENISPRINSILVDNMKGEDPTTYKGVLKIYGREVADKWQKVLTDAEAANKNAQKTHRKLMDEKGWSGVDDTWKAWNSSKARSARQKEVIKRQAQILENARNVRQGGQSLNSVTSPEASRKAQDEHRQEMKTRNETLVEIKNLKKAFCSLSDKVDVISRAYASA